MSKREWTPPFPKWKQWVARVGFWNPWSWVSWKRWRDGTTNEPTFALMIGTMTLIGLGIGLVATAVGLR